MALSHPGGPVYTIDHHVDALLNETPGDHEIPWRRLRPITNRSTAPT